MQDRRRVHDDDILHQCACAPNGLDTVCMRAVCVVCIMRTGDIGYAALCAVEMGAAYVWVDGDSYVVKRHRPDSPPYVVATPGDEVDVVLTRIRRLAAPDGGA